MLYIGVGRYSCFWKDFYETCEKNFIPEAEKHYFFVTDQDNAEVGGNVTLIHQEDLGWPCNTMFRFMFFLRKKEELLKCDYLFFCNANTYFKTIIRPEDILPLKPEEDGLLMLTWQKPDGDPETFNFERRKESAACVPHGTKQQYYQGTLNGGTAQAFVALLEGCHEIVVTDFRNGYVPAWHDESALNRYMMGRRCKLVDSEYGMPEHRDKNHTAKIIFTTKEKVLGRSWMRNFKKREHSNSVFYKILRKLGLS